MKMWHKMVGRKWNTNFCHDQTKCFPNASFQKVTENNMEPRMKFWRFMMRDYSKNEKISPKKHFIKSLIFTNKAYNCTKIGKFLAFNLRKLKNMKILANFMQMSKNRDINSILYQSMAKNYWNLNENEKFSYFKLKIKTTTKNLEKVKKIFIRFIGKIFLKMYQIALNSMVKRKFSTEKRTSQHLKKVKMATKFSIKKVKKLLINYGLLAKSFFFMCQ